MKWIVTADDIVDVVEEEATEDIQKLGGMQALDAPYLRPPLQDARQARGLAVRPVRGRALTATAMGHYESEIARAVVLALFVPLIISSGGNSGLSGDDAGHPRDGARRDPARRLLARSAAGARVGPRARRDPRRHRLPRASSPGQKLFGAYGPHYALLALAVAISLVGVVTWGTLAGALLPFVLRALRFDPASASAPFVATLADVSGLVIYFSAAEPCSAGAAVKRASAPAPLPGASPKRAAGGRPGDGGLGADAGRQSAPIRADHARVLAPAAAGLQLVRVRGAQASCSGWATPCGSRTGPHRAPGRPAS